MKRNAIFYLTKGKVKDGTKGFFLTTNADTPSMILGSTICESTKSQTVGFIKDCLQRMNLEIDDLYNAKVEFEQEQCLRFKIRRIEGRTFNLKFALRTYPMNEKEMDFFTDIFFGLMGEQKV